MKTSKAKITARKVGGDDSHSWAVFINGDCYVQGLTHREVPYYKTQAAEYAERKVTPPVR